jgi:predicted 3-demethylubiquinone-9 3-methyltransferase (glyoxalase superfamily)
MSDYIAGPDKAAANRAMQAMLKMSKIDLAAIKQAYAG